MTVHEEAARAAGVASNQPNSTPAIQTRELSKHYGPQRAVDYLTFSVPRGTIAGFIGPNGAGKTTTIRLLLGLVRPTSGSARVLDIGIDRPADYLQHVGALIEAPAFYPSLSGHDNLAILAELGGCARARVAEVLEIVGLRERAREAVRAYSLGMKQRLGIAAALLPNPELLILDEPANGLDPTGIIEIRDLLRGLRDEGKTIFLSSHLLGELERVADWLVMLNRGKALFCGPAQDLTAGRSELVVATADMAQLSVVSQIATAAGYTVTAEDGTLRIACPESYAAELSQRASAAGIVLTEIRRSQASLEERFLALLQGKEGHA